MFFAQTTSDASRQVALVGNGSWLDEIKAYWVKSGSDFLQNLAAAAVILIVGWLIGRWIGRVVTQWFEKVEMEPPVKKLIVRVIRIVVFMLTVVVAAQKMGVPVLPLVTSAGVIGLGVGLAMQGVLSNVVAGLSIIFTKPFRVGEYIEILGEEGRVESIELFTTSLSHPDLSRVVIPNRKIVGEVLHNYGTIRQMNLVVGVSYGTDINKVLSLVRDIMVSNSKVLKEPVPATGVVMLADSSVSIAIKPWVKVTDVGAAKVELYQEVLTRFKEHQIEIPFPQREVRMLKALEIETSPR